MKANLLKMWAGMPGLLGSLGLCLALASDGRAQTGYSSQARPTFGESFSSGMNRLGQAVTPKAPTKQADDPVSLQTPGKAGVDLYVAVARLNEESGKLPEAEAQYKKALQESSKDLRALLGYARLKDRMGEAQEALGLYQKAAKIYPQEPSVFNNLAVHYARRGMLGESAAAMEQAIRLRPKEPKYRNNIATLLVEMGRPQDAFAHLAAVHDEAIAHYNLGFLLTKKGQTHAAAQEFAMALRINPSLAQARQWLERLNQSPVYNPAMDAGIARNPPAAVPGPPMMPREQPRMATRPGYNSVPPSAPPEPPMAPSGRYNNAVDTPRPPAVRQLPPPPGLPPEADVPPPPADRYPPQRLPPVSGTSPADQDSSRYGEAIPNPPELVAPLPPGR